MKVEINDNVFHRDLNKIYPIISHGKGVYLFDKDGKRYLDGSSGAVAANLGHGVQEIVEKITEQALKVGFVHTQRFETDVLHQLSTRICELAPKGLSKVFYTCSGSEANESALKLVNQHHRIQGNQDKHLIIGRWQSYHGNTIGSLSVGGDVKRREPYSKLIYPFPHVTSPIFLKHRQQDYKEYVNAIEKKIIEIGPDKIAAFICEPIVGSQQGAIVPPIEYLKGIRELCNEYNLLMIVDEVMTGFGRTGEHFAVEHFDIVPDIITFGKGVTGGYLPLGGMIVQEHIISNIKENANGIFTHGFTYSGHPVLAAAGLAAIDYYLNNQVLQNCRRQGAYLLKKLQELYQLHSIIGSINGKGLLLGIELLKDRDSMEDFPANSKTSEMLNEITMKKGLVLYPGSGAKRGEKGQHILLAPPLTIQNNEIDEMVTILDDSLNILKNKL